MLSTFRKSAIALGAVALLAITGCSGGNSANSNGDGNASGGGSLVIDTAFSIETADPGHSYDPTGNMLAKAMYETLVDFKGSDVSTPIPGLASWEANDGATEFTFTLEDGRVFSDGSPIEAKDVVFSLQRIQGMPEAKPNFLLGGVTIEEVDAQTISFTTDTPLLQLPAILANPALGIVNSDVVAENGGTTSGTDTAQKFLDGESAGSGPFVLDTLDLSSQIVLKKNDEYNGDEKPAFDRVVIRNVTESATQLANLKGGDSMVAMDLNGDQVAGLGDGLKVDSVPSGQTIFLLLNQSEDVAGDLSNVKLAEGIRYALDYPALLELAGAGSVQATGVIPPGFEGALPKGITQDLDKAKAAFAEAGYTGQTLKLQFPNDYPVGGVEFTPLAERIQAQLKDAGVTVELAPAPFATELDAYVNGSEGFGLWFWGPDYADSANFLPFGPGLKVGLRSGWAADANSDIAGIAADAASATDPDERTTAFTSFAEAMQADGPFVPLIVPGRNIATSDKVDGAVYNSVWEMDIAEITPAG
ncbi:Dipeptide-binding ABC transporter, periplasmic substrate-binding component (TC 3.A.1.5.2) [Microbacterium esteraromaticum]|uniref:Dipeptide-binding ABC transporter, periplasmic substrate-binding component (TC 3.A.1.5.2) n=1 Tax=Microbacterium esteraromaticum TaxID=57043 RepID=A0A1R4IKL6_9MICO|nr:ABC transporter substrate-binding protein [Microbacterium esteraromaticum]SJN20195.1 Dipeptide-binding ABC transporter, periplasmic substrate-binding component (TC 3.A.1.5.2) [Microbacterium esteraromaticum]